jgi:hypothetical protein
MIPTDFMRKQAAYCHTAQLCPLCGNNNEMQLMPVSDYESYKLDHDYINEMASELWTNKGGASIG